jgi:hypothetical protein
MAIAAGSGSLATYEQNIPHLNAVLRGGPWHEDVLDELYEITPTSTPFYNFIGDGKASSIWQDWSKRALLVRKANAAIEGRIYAQGDFEATQLGTRLSNWCQIFARLPRVTGTEEAMDPVGIGNLLADQIQFHQVGLKTDIEHALIRGTLQSAGTGITAPRTLKGAIKAAANTTHFATDATFRESHFNDVHERGWDRGAMMRDCLVSGRVKRWISGFTASSTKYVFHSDKSRVNAVDVYESDFYLTRIHLSHDMAVSDTAPNIRRGMLFFDRDNYKKAWLRRPRRRPIPLPSDGTEVELLAECTLRYGHDAAGAYISAIYLSVHLRPAGSGMAPPVFL